MIECKMTPKELDFTFYTSKHFKHYFLHPLENYIHVQEYQKTSVRSSFIHGLIHVSHCINVLIYNFDNLLHFVSFHLN